MTGCHGWVVGVRRSQWDKPKAADGWTFQRPRGRRDLIAEVVAEIDREAGCEELRRRLDSSIDLEVKVVGEPGVVRPTQLVRVAALYDPPSRRRLEQPDRRRSIATTR